MRRYCLAGLPLLLMLVTAGTLKSETITLSPDEDWFRVLHGEGLSPGDIVELTAGRYQDERRLSMKHKGTANAPITIRAREGAAVVFMRPDANQNSINLDGASHLRLTGIEITGGAAGIRISRTPSSNDEVVGIQIHDCYLHDLGGVAITCNEPGTTYRQCHFTGNHIHHTSGHGEAFYLGGNNATAKFHDGRIERNYIHHLNGASISQGDGIEIKDGSSGNRVVANVIHDTHYPGITTYGSGGGPVNRIERNLIWNTRDHGIQAAADAIINNNTIAMTGQAGIYSRDHQGAVCGNLTITRNVIFHTQDAAIRINNEQGSEEPTVIEIRHNQLHPQDGDAMRIQRTQQVRILDNRGSTVLKPPLLDPNWKVTEQIDWSLPTDSLHPAWQFIELSSLREKLFTRDGR